MTDNGGVDGPVEPAAAPAAVPADTPASAPAAPAAEPERADAHPFVSPSLFVDITTITVDPAYVAAAARRTGAPSRPTSALSVLALLAVGIVCGVAAQQARERAPAAQRIRSSLVTEAGRRTELTDSLAERRAALRRETAGARDEQLRQSVSGRALTEELARLELAVGGTRVSGPGLVVTLDDGPGADVEEDGRVTDTDLQAVVNALWTAGAEAVSVNDRRVGTLTAIREAGEAILVDYRPVSPPYVVRAVGDPDTVEPAFSVSATAGRFRTYASAYGMEFDVKRAKSLTLPGTETSGLRHARPIATEERE